MKFNNNIIENLIKKASQSDVYYKHAAALIYKDTIYSINCNKSIQENKTIHAEINVLLPIYKTFKKYLTGVDIIVIRINNKCELKNSRPCNECIDKLTIFEKYIIQINMEL